MYEESYKILCPDWAIYILKSAGKVYSTPKEKPCETDETVHNGSLASESNLRALYSLYEAFSSDKFA